MKKFKHFVLGGIENKLFNLILITAVVLSAAFILLGVLENRMLTDVANEANEKQKDSINEITSETMTYVVEQSLSNTARLQANIYDDLFSELRDRVLLQRDYADKLLNHPENVPPHDYSFNSIENTDTKQTYVMLADGVELTEELDARIRLIANMSDMMLSLFDVNEDADSCYVALPEGVFLQADDLLAIRFDENGNLRSYDPRTRPWYTQAAEAGDVIFTDIMSDAFTKDICITCAAPVYVNGELSAVVGSDLFLTSMQQEVEDAQAEGGFLCVVNRDGRVMFSPAADGPFKADVSEGAPTLFDAGNEGLSSFLYGVFGGNTKTERVTLSDGEYFITGAPIETVGWYLIGIYSVDASMASAATLREKYEEIQAEAAQTYQGESRKLGRLAIAIVVFLLAVCLAFAVILGKRIVKPLNTITRRIAELSESNQEFKMEDVYRTGDEIELLAQSFADISHKTVLYVEQVKAVTAEKERIGTELHMATQIQESMLPSIFPAYPERPEFDIYALMHPAKEVGGDFYDFFLIDDDHLCMVMADVSGKGVPGALFMMASKIIIQSCAMLGVKSPADILAKANEAICSNNRMGMFVTVWLGILEISSGKVWAANAGHEYPAIMRKGGQFELLRDKHGLVIGGMEEARYRAYELSLAPGDKLFLYTDGVAEATNAGQEMFGTERMLRALNTAPDAEPNTTLANVLDAVHGFVADAEQFDDITMMCVEYKGTAAGAKD